MAHERSRTQISTREPRTRSGSGSSRKGATTTNRERNDTHARVALDKSTSRSTYEESGAPLPSNAFARASIDESTGAFVDEAPELLDTATHAKFVRPRTTDDGHDQ